MTRARDVANIDGILTAKGDIYAATAAATPARLAVGSNGAVLTADSAVSTGVKWATPSSGGMTLLSTTNISSANFYTTVDNINQSYNDLYIVIRGVRCPNTSRPGIGFRNGTNGWTNRSTVLSYNSTAVAGSTTGVFNGGVNWGSTASNTDSIITCYLYDYAATSTSHKTAYMSQGFYDSTSTQVGTWSFSVLYTTTAAAINSIQISDAQGVGNLTSGTILIYGVK